MRFRTSLPAAACALTAVLGAAGCSAVGSIVAAPPATSPAAGSAAGTAGGGAGGAGQAGTQAPSVAASRQPAAPGSAGRCEPASLGFALGPKVSATAATQPAQVVELTNEGSSACTMEGFPGVNLVGTAAGRKDYTWPLARASASFARESHMAIAKVTLAPGATAHFEIRYLPGSPGHGNRIINVATMVITPPNDYTQAELGWHQDVVLQDAAARPGTYLMPVVAGS